jgi:hypothetical protein
MIIQPWPAMPLTCNPSFNCPCQRPSCSAQIQTKQKTIDPSSYRVTVRRITPSHVAATATETYRAHRNKDSDTIHFEQFNQTVQTNDIYGDDHFYSNRQNIPLVPSKKTVSKNNGIQVSSTSFITTTDDQVKYFIKELLILISFKHYL